METHLTAALNLLNLGEVERGEKIISIEALLQIATALKTSIREIFRDLQP